MFNMESVVFDKAMFSARCALEWNGDFPQARLNAEYTAIEYFGDRPYAWRFACRAAQAAFKFWREHGAQCEVRSARSAYCAIADTDFTE